jgi:hypothetical protein
LQGATLTFITHAMNSGLKQDHDHRIAYKSYSIGSYGSSEEVQGSSFSVSDLFSKIFDLHEIRHFSKCLEMLAFSPL